MILRRIIEKGVGDAPVGGYHFDEIARGCCPLRVAMASIDGHTMRTQSPEADVGAFLRSYVDAIDGGANFDLWQTAKNNAFLYDSGFTREDVILVVKSLKVVHYSWGPEPDEDANRPQGDVWMFWAEYEGFELYVKLKLEGAGTGNVRPAVCMSCHEPDFEIQRPYWPRRGR